MSIKRHKLPKVILGVCLMGLLGFKDIGMFVKDENQNESKMPSENIELTKRINQTANRSSYTNESAKIMKVVKSAYDKLGSKYVYADTGKSGYDCSGLTYSIYLSELGIKLNRSSIDQLNDGVYVDREDLIPGDLVFFKTTSRRIGHVGLYIGEGNMIHASSSQNRVMITNINEKEYYSSRYVTARRIIK